MKVLVSMLDHLEVNSSASSLPNSVQLNAQPLEAPSLPSAHTEDVREGQDVVKPPQMYTHLTGEIALVEGF